MRPLCAWFLGFLAAVPALAGEVYVPFVASHEPGADATRSTAVAVELHNQGTVPRRAAVRFVAAGDDGREGGAMLASLTLRPGAVSSLTCCQDRSGLLVVTGAPQIAVSVRLQASFPQPAPNSVVVRLPLLATKDAAAAGSPVSLERLVADLAGHATSSLGVVNLSREEAHCSVQRLELAERFPQLAAIVVPPLSVAAFPNLTGGTIYGHPAVGPKTPLPFYATRPTVTCDQPSYAFALTYSGAPGDPFGLPWIELVPPVFPLGSEP